MKIRTLVVGSGYIGKNFAAYAREKPEWEELLDVDIVDSYRGWEMAEFEEYDAVIFAAGIAHRKQTRKNKELYFTVNRDLAYAVAEKAKTANVRQFVYISTMAVYGKKEGEISEYTLPRPRKNDYYGRSKLQAEIALESLESPDFELAVLRPPMVYGANCPGKFGQLVKLAKRLPLVPDSKNKRSILYIDNLSELLCSIVLSKGGGIFCPQNREYVNTADLIRLIRRQFGKKTLIIPRTGLVVRLGKAVFPPLRTAFGSLFYSQSSAIPLETIDIETSVRLSCCNEKSSGRAGTIAESGNRMTKSEGEIGG